MPDDIINAELSRSKISPCLWFKADAEQAVTFYVSLLPDSRIDHVQRNTVETPAGPAGSVLAIDFTLAGRSFVALNGGVVMEYGHAVSFHIDCDDQAEVDRLWTALSDGGEEEQCGWLRDRYGVPWQVVPKLMRKLLGDPDRERSGRAMQAMMQMVKIDCAALQAAFDGANAT